MRDLNDFVSSHWIREWTDRYSLKSILILVDNGDNAVIGDTVISLSRFKFLKYYFPNSEIDINSPSKIWHQMSMNLHHIKEVTNQPASSIDYGNYDLIVLCVDKKTPFLEAIAAYWEGNPGRDLSLASIHDPIIPVKGDVHVPLLREVFEFKYPQELVDDVNRCEVALSAAERREAAELLDSRIGDEKILVYFDRASEFRKILKMSVNLEVIRYLQSMEGRRLVLFDPFDEPKDGFYRYLGVDTSNICFLKGLSVRQTAAVMADKRVEMILGPCTGLMHVASGVYNFVLKNGLISRPPVILVYTGLYKGTVTNVGAWWSQRLADCIVIRNKGGRGKKAVKLSDLSQSQLTMQEDILPCMEYTFDMIKEHIERNYEVFRVAVK